jgi:2',3'-cyclic-nucleotide 2'-phosphodiesterase (5'-nucleotidase family)
MAGTLGIFKSNLPHVVIRLLADPEGRPSFSADWGDYISFAERLHEQVDKTGVDLLLVDTGDRVEGNGLYDASDPKGKYTLDIFAEQDIDLICSGNHELYKANSSNNEYEKTVPNFAGNYLASNLDIFDPKTGERKALAQRYKKFTTKNLGIRIIAFGFLYDFTGNANNTVVQKVKDTIKEEWFQQAIRDREVDLFLVIGHVQLRSQEFAELYRAIREQQWDVPIQFFGGHTHIRDYAKYDSKAYALESGRYMETIGFMSISGMSIGKKSSGGEFKRSASPTFFRRYIDNNLFSFYRHSHTDETTFPTEHGRNVSAMIASARKKLQLDKTYGCAPRDYWTNRAPYPSEHSIFRWLGDEVLPGVVRDPKRGDKPRMVLTNTGAIRFDIFRGPFTVDSTYIVSPFTSGFRYVKDVPFSVAKRLLQILNQEVPQLWPASQSFAFKPPAKSNQIRVSDNVGGSFQAQDQMPLGTVNTFNGIDLTPGYTTTDDGGSEGDDTMHAPITFYRVPNCLESRIDFPPTSTEAPTDPASVDLIYVDFIESYILLALKFLGTDFEEKDTEVYMPGRDMTSLIADWVKENWKCE